MECVLFLFPCEFMQCVLFQSLPLTLPATALLVSMESVFLLGSVPAFKAGMELYVI